MKEIVIVTAFFDIGRKDYSKMKRTNEQYFFNFEFWARIQNRVIVFCESNNHKEKILKIREKFGLREKTEVVIIEDITKIIEPEYKKMEEISQNKYFQNIRVYKNTLSNKPLYDLVNYLKLYFIYQAKLLFDIKTQLAWFDFGFNHGGAYYQKKEDFDFHWQYDCNGKAHFFYENELDIRPMFEVIRTVKPDPILGAMFIVPAIHVETLWKNLLESIHSMLDMGLLDDDQPLLLATYRKSIDICIAVKCRNCEQLKLCDANLMNYTIDQKRFVRIRKIKKYLEKRIRIYKYHKADKKILLKTLE